MNDGLQLPKLKPYMYIIPHDTGGVQIRFRDSSFLLDGATAGLFYRLCPLLNGENSIASICETLSGEYSGPVISRFISKLGGLKLIEDCSVICGALEPEIRKRYRHSLDYFSLYTANAVDLQQRLCQSKVLIWGLGHIGSRLLTGLCLLGVGNLKVIDSTVVSEEDLEANPLFYTSRHVGELKAKIAEWNAVKLNPLVNCTGLFQDIRSKKELVELLEQIDFLVFAAESFSPWHLGLINRACVDAKVPWLRCCVEDGEGIVGPTVVPGQTSCYECYNRRIKSNLKYPETYSEFEDHLLSNPLPMGHGFGLSPFYDIVAQLGALELLKHLTKLAMPTTYNCILTIDFPETEIKKHNVLKVPACPVCGRDVQMGGRQRIWQDAVFVMEYGTKGEGKD